MKIIALSLSVVLSLMVSACASTQVGPNDYWNKQNFKYETFAKEARECGRTAQARVANQGAIYGGGGGGLAGILVVGIISGAAKANSRREYAIECMSDKGYALEPIDPEERQKRIAYMEEYAAKEKAAKEAAYIASTPQKIEEPKSTNNLSKKSSE